MSFVIDEMVHEAPPAAEASRPANGPEPGPTATQAPDLDRLEFHRGRRRHRAERLWAD